ncbi:MAG: phage protein Gp36 family protein [Paracoccaceae bacterium]
MYATHGDITRLYGPDALHVAVLPDGSGADLDAVDRAIASACAEIDTFLAVRYALPFAAAPAALVQPAVDIALYRLASSRQVLSDDLRARFEDAIAMLKRLSSGTQELVLSAPAPAPAPAEGEEAAPPAPPNPIVVEGAPRLFDRKSMRGL